MTIACFPFLSAQFGICFAFVHSFQGVACVTLSIVELYFNILSFARAMGGKHMHKHIVCNRMRCMMYKQV